jgi:hypothetical protein
MNEEIDQTIKKLYTVLLTEKLLDMTEEISDESITLDICYLPSQFDGTIFGIEFNTITGKIDSTSGGDCYGFFGYKAVIKDHRDNTETSVKLRRYHVHG